MIVFKVVSGVPIIKVLGPEEIRFVNVGSITKTIRES